MSRRARQRDQTSLRLASRRAVEQPDDDPDDDGAAFADAVFAAFTAGRGRRAMSNPESAIPAAAQAPAVPAVNAATGPLKEPVTLEDVLDALNLFNRPKPNEDEGPWEGGHYIRVDHLPAFINIIAAAWFGQTAPQPAPVAQPDAAIAALTAERDALRALVPAAYRALMFVRHEMVPGDQDAQQTFDALSAAINAARQVKP